MNLFIILIIILIILGTKFVNYYYNFFYIYKQLNNSEKIKYFSNVTLVKLISKNSRFKSFITIYVLTPLIKITYLIISTLIYLLYAICEYELDNILLHNNFTSYKQDLINYDLDNQEPVINFVQNNNDGSNLNDKLILPNNSPTILKDDVDLFMSKINLDDSLKDNILKTDFSEENILKIFKKSDVFTSNIIEFNLTNIDNNVNYNLDKNNANDTNDILDNLVKIENSINEDINNTNNDNLNDYIIEDYKIDDCVNEENFKEMKKPEDEQIETIAIEEIDFGEYMTNLINDSDKKPELQVDITKMVEVNVPVKIKIGKKRVK